jgi:hypothetical protein
MSELTDSPAPQPPSPSFWTKEKLDIWVRVGVPTLATFVLGVATFFIDSSVSTRADREQSSRLYTELISRREQAASELRKDMFSTILSGFLNADADGSSVVGSKRLDQDLMKLELLALNFGESLSLGPLFAMMDRRIHTDSLYATQIERLDRSKLLHRLESLARRVADAQRGSLGIRAKDFEFSVPSAQIGENATYSWPDTLDDESSACLVLGLAQRTFFFTFSEVRTAARTVDVHSRIQTLALSDEAPDSCVEKLSECGADMPAHCSQFLKSYPTTGSFTLDPFNLPLIDNSLLADDQRFALLMRRFSEKEIEIVGLLFPGAYAGRRDKLTLDQAIEELRGRIE